MVFSFEVFDSEILLFVMEVCEVDGEHEGSGVWMEINGFYISVVNGNFRFWVVHF